MKTRGKWRRRACLLSLVAALAGASVTVTGCFGPFGRRTFITVGTAVDILPSGFVTVRVGTGRYFYHRGVFYQPYRGGFLVVTAPLGAVIPRPPGGHVMILVENDPFAYYRGVFYQPVPAGYVVSESKNGLPVLKKG